MTVALAAAGAVKNAIPKSATLGALVMLAGGALVYWALYRSRDGQGLFGLGEAATDGVPPVLGALTGSGRGFGGSFAPEPGKGGQGAALAAPDLVNTLRDAGFHGDALRTALAVAKGESGWRPNATGDLNLQNDEWGPSIGLFQIRCRWEEVGTGKPRDCDALRDPSFNARAAYEISKHGKDWSPWTAYTSGAFRRYLDDARKAIERAVS